jgi:glycosyltransferase involved in cell wall biosynthesis
MRQNSHSAVSVIVPWLDVPVADVIRAVRSVLRQDFAGFVEVVICNDGSSPHLTDALTASLAEQPWGRVEHRVCHHDRTSGASAARNTAVRAARGDWLLWLDADDVLAPDALATLVRHAERTGAGLAMSQCWVIEHDRRLRRQPEVYLKLGRRYHGTVFDPLAQVVFSLHPQLMRRDRFDELGGFDESYRWAEVTDLFLRFVIRQSLNAMVMIDQPLYSYHRRGGSLSANRERMEAARRRALLSYARSLSLPIEEVRYLGRCAETGAQHYLPIVAGQAVRPPYMKTRDGHLLIEHPAASSAQVGKVLAAPATE